MIFRQKDEIRSGAKTQTRRLADPNAIMATVDDLICAVTVINKKGNPRLKYALGLEMAAVPKRGQKSFGRIRITALRVEHLQAITEADANKEGVASVDQYRELWNSINKSKKTNWDSNPLVVVIDFEYCGDV